MKRPQSVSDLATVCGMSQPETLDFLVARGHKVSLGALKAWHRGIYATPAPVILEMWGLANAVWADPDSRYDRPIPDEAPDCVRRRSEIIHGTRLFSQEVDPEDPYNAHEREEQEAHDRGDD